MKRKKQKTRPKTPTGFSRTERQIFRTACKHLKSDLTVRDILPGTTTDACAAWLTEEVASYGSVFSDRRRERARERASDDCAALHLWLCELGAGIYLDLLLIADTRGKANQPVLWDSHERPFGTPYIRQFLFTTMCMQMNNYLRAAVEMGRGGFELQLLALFRGQVELSDTMIACIGDHDFFATYAAQLHEKAEQAFDYREWNRTRSPRVIRGKVDAILRRNELFTAAEATERHEYRANTYEWLSGHHHGHPIALFVRSFDEDAPTVGGLPGPQTTALLGKICWQTYEALSIIEMLLTRLHGWAYDRSIPICRDAAYRLRAYRVLASLTLQVEDLIRSKTVSDIAAE